MELDEEDNETEISENVESSKHLSTLASVISKTDSRKSNEDQNILDTDFEINYELDEEQEESPISLEHDMRNAKAYLKKQSLVEGVSLYDHLSQLLNKVLSERPDDVVDYFEEYSRKMKEERFRSATDHLQDVYIPPQHHACSKKLMPLFLPAATTVEEVQLEEEEDAQQLTKPDLMELLFYFQQAGVGLPMSEMYCIALALRNLVQSQPIKTYRFWGKILGIEKNYIIAETELKPEEYERRNMEKEEVQENMEEVQENKEEEELEKAPEESIREHNLNEGEEKEVGEEEEGGGKTQEIIKEPPKLPPLPVSSFKKPPEAPAEKSGQGINKKVYYVCNSPGDEWVMLPDVTPQQITVSRKIKKYFTGNLETEILTYPIFPGKEINYLRAQIARISAGTQISPLGFYRFDEDEEEEAEEDEGGRTDYIENPEFEPIPLQDLVDTSMSFWVHHTLHILKQGRTAWWSSKAKLGEEEAEEEEEAEPEEEQETKEVGPSLLTPLSEDATIETVAPWNARISSQLLLDNAIAVIRSNLWPGAYAFAKGRKLENVYMGWGHKFVTYNYSPPPMETLQKEYSLGPEIMEIKDPTPEDEEAWRLAHEKKVPPKEEGEEEEEGGAEEEEDEDEDEDD